MKTNFRFRRIDFPTVEAIEVAPVGYQLYVWMGDGRSGVVDMSEWTGHPCDKWDEEGFDRWRMDAGMPCWGEGSHFSEDLFSRELEDYPYEEWSAAFSDVSVAV